MFICINILNYDCYDRYYNNVKVKMTVNRVVKYNIL
jgi:hypothetical protein